MVPVQRMVSKLSLLDDGVIDSFYGAFNTIISRVCAVALNYVIGRCSAERYQKMFSKMS